MKMKILTTVFLTAAAFLFVRSQIQNRPFAAAEDFPRGALVYAQTGDLPAIIKLWNESKFKEKYPDSKNFSELQNRHLGLKLASRWAEFNAAAGFDLDLETLSGLTENRASIAVYDIGKLDFVLIAPVSGELFAATKFAGNQAHFTAETLADETVVYRTEIAADRGRQKQELIFTHVKNRFVLATSEKLLAQTLTNINGNTGKNSLSDEPDFKILSEDFEPRTATVWVNQTALNDDYYFKRYWLMSETKDLKNIRAGIFDFSAEAGKLIERRKFALVQPKNSPNIKPKDAVESLAFVPEDVPIYQLQTADAQTSENAVRATIFAREKKPESGRRHSSHYFSNYDDGSETPDYSSPGENYDQNIDEQDDDLQIANVAQKNDFTAVLQSAQPQTVLTFSEPQVSPAPLFVEFKRGAVFTLAAPENFDKTAFEAAIVKKFASQITVSGQNMSVNWESKPDGNSDWRALNLPMLGWQAVYAVRGNKLVVANNAEFFGQMLNARNSPPVGTSGFPLTELTMLNLAHRKTDFDDVFKRLGESGAADDFFSGNVGSLLDSVSEIKTIEIKRNYWRKNLNEEIVVTF